MVFVKCLPNTGHRTLEGTLTGLKEEFHESAFNSTRQSHIADLGGGKV